MDPSKSDELESRLQKLKALIPKVKLSLILICFVERQFTEFPTLILLDGSVLADDIAFNRDIFFEVICDNAWWNLTNDSLECDV